MNQFFFGKTDFPLYGVHHAPLSHAYRESAILVCYPLGREYMRCHRALVRFCDRLALAGYHSLRFDYCGTGDSAGESGDGTFAEWLANTRAAAQELRDVSGVQKISLVGVRLGAAIAAHAAADESPVDTLLLWDPIINGDAYIQQLVKMHEAFLVDLDRFPKIRTRSRDSDELVGIPCPAMMRESIRQVDLSTITNLTAKRVSLVVTEDRAEYRQLLDYFEALTPVGDYHVVQENPAWDALSDLGTVMMPHQLLQKMISVIVKEPL